MDLIKLTKTQPSQVNLVLLKRIFVTRDRIQQTARRFYRIRRKQARSNTRPAGRMSQTPCMQKLYQFVMGYLFLHLPQSHVRRYLVSNMVFSQVGAKAYRCHPKQLLRYLALLCMSCTVGMFLREWRAGISPPKLFHLNVVEALTKLVILNTRFLTKIIEILAFKNNFK